MSVLNKDEYIKKLERRIHNQRVALRENWMMIEQRANYTKRIPLRNMWWDYVMKLTKEIKRINAELEKKV